MYEVRQNKEKVSRRIDVTGGGTRQRVKSINPNIVTKTNLYNSGLPIQREPIYLNNYIPEHQYKIGFSTFTSHSKASYNILNNISATELKAFPVLWAGHTMLSSELESKFPDIAKDDVSAKGYWTRSGSLLQSIKSTLSFLRNHRDIGVLNDDTALLSHPDIKTIYVYVSRRVFGEWRRIVPDGNMTYTHSPNIDSANSHNCVSFALSKAWQFTMNMLDDKNLDSHDKDAMIKLNEFIEGAVITLRNKLAQPNNSSQLKPGLQGYFLKYISEKYEMNHHNTDWQDWGITNDDIWKDLFGHNDDSASYVR